MRFLETLVMVGKLRPAIIKCMSEGSDRKTQDVHQL